MNSNLHSLMRILVGNSELHARWLNTLSYLEYIGFRKIVKSQVADVLDLNTLGHAVEEGRHALLLKKLAVKKGGLQFNTYAAERLLCGEEAGEYFQALDRACECHLASDSTSKPVARLMYLYVTWLIELRALSVYGIYQESLTERGMQPPLNSLLGEEDRHLAEVEMELLKLDPSFTDRSKELRAIEEKLSQKFILAMSQEILGRQAGIGVSI